MLLHRLITRLIAATASVTLVATVAATSADAATDRQAPSRPGPLTVRSVGTSTATVSFGRSHDDVGVARYVVYGNGRVVARSTHVRGVVVHLRCGTTYTLGARAVDRAGHRSTLSPVAHARTHACLDTTAPARPGTLRMTARTATTVTLAWAASRDPGHGPVSQYVLSRDGATVGGTHATSYTFRGLQPAQTYVFGVAARDAVGNASPVATLRLTTARPPQATGSLRPFVLATDTASVLDAKAHYRDLQWIYPTYFEVTEQGLLTGSDQPAVTHWFQLRGVKVLPRFHSEDAGYIEAVATDPARRAALVDEIVSTVRASGFDGAALDLELNMPSTGIDGLTKQQRWDRLRTGFTTLVQDLAAALHAAGRLLSVDVATDWCSHNAPVTREVVYCSSSSDPSTVNRARPYLYDYRALAAAADELWLLAWGLHWATSDPGALAGTPWLTAVGAYFHDLFADEPALLTKFTLGVQLYGFDWSSRTVRTDTVAMPGGTVPAAPACYAGSSVPARPVYQYAGDASAGTLTVTWLCNTRTAQPLEYADIVSVLAAAGVSPTWDATTQEATATFPDPDAPGAQRSLWFANAASVTARATLAEGLGWHLGLWRLGREDQALWTPAVARTGAGS